MSDAERVSVAEASMRLGLNREQVVRRIQRGIIEGGKVLGQWYVTQSGLERFQREQNAPDGPIAA